MNETTTTDAQTLTPTTPRLPTLKAAFAKAQALFTAVPNTMWHEDEGYSYSSLAASLDMVRPHLAKFGLLLTQRVDCNERGVSCLSVLMHESGEELEGGSIFLPAASTKAADLGALMHSARKFSAQALLCIASQGESPSRPRNEQEGGEQSRRRGGRQERARAAHDAASKSRQPTVWQRLVEVAKIEGLGIEQLSQLAKKVSKRTVVTSGLTEEQFKAVVEAIAEAKKSEAA